jgi:phage terminase large subunit-like protein
MRANTGGRIDFWTLENERAGRSRKYKLAIIDEGAFGKDNVMSIWEKSIKPTLLDLSGKAVVTSNANGISPNNFLYQVCNDPKYGFAEYHGPTSQNPYMPERLPGEGLEEHQLRRDEAMDELKRNNHPLVYRQEYLAEFVDWSGVAFFGRDSLLVNDEPYVVPYGCDAVFATIDTAVKTGSEHDATAVTFWAINMHGTYPLVVLDWDITQIEGSLLVAWLPSVFQNLEALAKQFGARGGSLGVWIEDKVSGTILLQQAARNGMNAHSIDSKLTAVGKDERAISVSGYVYRGQVKISVNAYEKVTSYKGFSRNHFMNQVMGFRIGVKDQDDDLLDTFTYGVAIALGNGKGY